MYAQVWDRSRSNSEIIAIADQIAAAIGEGTKIQTDGGYLVIWPETPLTQVMVDGDFRSVYFNLSINAYNMPGA